MIRDPAARACGRAKPAVGPTRTFELDPGSAALRALSGMTALSWPNPPPSSRTSARGAMIRDPAARACGRAKPAVALTRTFELDPGSAALRALSGMTALSWPNPPPSSRTSAAGAMIRDPSAQACRSRSSAVSPTRTFELDPGSAALRALSGMTALSWPNPPPSSRTSAAGAMIRDPSAQACGSRSSAVGPTRTFELDPGSAALRALSGMTALSWPNPPPSSRTSARGAMIRDPAARACGRAKPAVALTRTFELDPGSSALRALSGTTALSWPNPPPSSRTSARGAMSRDPAARACGSRSSAVGLTRTFELDSGSAALRALFGTTALSWPNPPPSSRTSARGAMIRDPAARACGRAKPAVGPTRTFELDPGSAALRALSGMTALSWPNPPPSSRTSARGAMIRDPSAQACGSRSSAVGPTRTFELDPGSAALRALSGMTALSWPNPPPSSRTSAGGAMIRDPSAQACRSRSSAVGPTRTFELDPGSAALRALSGMTALSWPNPPPSSRTSARGAMIRDPSAQACGSRSSAVGLTRTFELDPGSAALRALSGMTALSWPNPPPSSRTSAGGAMIRDPSAQACRSRTRDPCGPDRQRPGLRISGVREAERPLSQHEPCDRFARTR